MDAARLLSPPATRRRLWLASLLAIAVGLVAAPLVHAQVVRDSIVWNNPYGGAWTDASNWSPANVPDAESEAAVLRPLVGPYQVVLNAPISVGGLTVEAGGPTLVVSDKKLTVVGFVFNRGTIRVQDGGTLQPYWGTIRNLGGALVAGSGGGTVLCYGPNPYAPGTLDNGSHAPAGTLVSDGGDLAIHCAEILNGEVRRSSGSGSVKILLAAPYNLTVTQGSQLWVAGLLDLLSGGSSLFNHGTVLVSGQVNVDGYAGNAISFAGDGELVLDEGTLDTPAGATMINQAGHTIRGCGTIRGNLVNYGTIESSCNFSALQVTGAVENHGAMKDASGILWITGDGARVTNLGSLSVAGGTMWIDQGASIDNQGGVIGAYGRPIEVGRGSSASIRGGLLEGSGEGMLHNQGTVTLEDIHLAPTAAFRTWPGATTNATGASLVNEGMMRVEGTLSLGPATDYLQSGGATSLEGGSIGAPRGLQIQGGELRGHGTIAGAVTSAGTVSPDPLLGALRIEGDYHQTPAGRLNVGFAGSGPGQVSRLDITGGASLGGSLEAASVGGYDPVPGHPYEVMSFGSVSGAFASVLGSLAGQLDVSAIYDADGVGLVVSGVTGVGTPEAPKTLRVYGRSGSGTASFVIELPREARVTIDAYDAAGRAVARLADGVEPAGVHAFPVVGNGARMLPTGLYFARVQVRSGTQVEIRTARVLAVK